MTNQRVSPIVQSEKKTLRRQKLGTLFTSHPSTFITQEEKNTRSPTSPRFYSNSAPTSTTSSPSTNFMSPWNLNQPSPYVKSPWIQASPLQNYTYDGDNKFAQHRLIGSLFREEGHVYSLAASGEFLFTGSESKNVRVWKNLKEFSGFKSRGFVKAIVVSGDKIFTGHQDGKIRVWKLYGSSYKRIGNLPSTKEYIKKSINPKNYVEVRRHRNVPWIKHFDAVSCMSLDEEQGLLYSGSWDKTLKVWRLSDFKCLESVNAHHDAVNSVVVGFDRLIFTGSADGTVKVWRRELVGTTTRYILVQTLLEQEFAVTALAVNTSVGLVYTGLSDGLVNFWERENSFLEYGGVLRGHKMAVLCLVVGGNNLVFSGSADKTICAWRREEDGVHTCISVLTGHNGPVKCLAVEKDNNNNDDDDENEENQRWIVYSGSLDKSVNVWSVCDYAFDLK